MLDAIERLTNALNGVADAFADNSYDQQIDFRDSIPFRVTVADVSNIKSRLEAYFDGRGVVFSHFTVNLRYFDNELDTFQNWAAFESGCVNNTKPIKELIFTSYFVSGGDEENSRKNYKFTLRMRCHIDKYEMHMADILHDQEAAPNVWLTVEHSDYPRAHPIYLEIIQALKSLPTVETKLLFKIFKKRWVSSILGSFLLKLPIPVAALSGYVLYSSNMSASSADVLANAALFAAVTYFITYLVFSLIKRKCDKIIAEAGVCAAFSISNGDAQKITETDRRQKSLARALCGNILLSIITGVVFSFGSWILSFLLGVFATILP